jgi:mono/diheme cytochrome c family protein
VKLSAIRLKVSGGLFMHVGLLACLTVLVLMGCKASTPGSIEGRTVREIKQRITVGGKDWKNPVARNQEAIEAGAFHFQHHCQICHGLDGRATGVPFASKMDPPVPDLSSKDIQEYTDGQLKWIIENGIAPSGMPAWKGIVNDDEMWKIVHFMRNLPAAGSLGAPDVYKEGGETHESAQRKPKQESARQKPKDSHKH